MNGNNNNNNNNSNSNEDKIRQFLKKSVQVDTTKQQTIAEKQEFVRRKLFTEQTHSHSFQKQRTVWERLQDAAQQGYGYFRTRRFRLFMKDTLPFLAFFSFSTFILYKMELQFDKMNQSVFKVKTIKQQEIERENEYIAKALRGDKFSAQDNQITDVPDKRNKYKFEEVEGDDSIEFDTRDDFLEGLRKDYNSGIQIADEYKDQVFSYASREKKQIGFGIGLTKGDQNNEQDDNLNQQQQKAPRKVPRNPKNNQRSNKADDDDLGYDGFGPSNN